MSQTNIEIDQMLPAQRAKFIRDRVSVTDAVRVDDLAKELDVSPITIRRDLVQLEKQGFLSRIRGGAVRRNYLAREEGYDSKKYKHQLIKRRMAEVANAHIPDGATLILDAGTSTFALAQLIAKRPDITCVTYDLEIATEVAAAGLRTFVAGGEVQNSTLSAYGRSAEDFIGKLNVDIAFIGVASITRDGRLYTPTMEKASLKSVAMAAAQKRVLLADRSKFYWRSFCEICGLGDFDVLITDADVTRQQLEEMRAPDLEVVRVDVPEDSEGVDG